MIYQTVNLLTYVFVPLNFRLHRHLLYYPIYVFCKNKIMSALFYINLHKILVTPVVMGMMFITGNMSAEACIYLAVHGTYSLLWLMKEHFYPDRRFMEPVPGWAGWLFIFLPLGGYYLAPWLLFSRHVSLPPAMLGVVIAMFMLGIFLHYVADAQKFYTLQYRKGLIQEGLFSFSRNPNYLGEILIYLSLAIMSMHWLPFVVLAGWCVFFIRNMRKKDRSLSRYPDYEKYRKKTRILLWENCHRHATSS